MARKGGGCVSTSSHLSLCPPCALQAVKTVCLVGKGIVYDTGGLGLKGKDGMCGMKADMGGAAAVSPSAARGRSHQTARLCAATRASVELDDTVISRASSRPAQRAEDKLTLVSRGHRS